MRLTMHKQAIEMNPPSWRRFPSAAGCGVPTHVPTTTFGTPSVIGIDLVYLQLANPVAYVP